MPEETVDELLRQLEGLQIQEALVIERIRQARTREQQASVANELIDRVKVPFAVGCVVEITNAVRPLHGPITNKDRRVKVTKVTENRIYLITESGNHTWRVHKNLRFISFSS